MTALADASLVPPTHNVAMDAVRRVPRRRPPGARAHADAPLGRQHDLRLVAQYSARFAAAAAADAADDATACIDAPTVERVMARVGAASAAAGSPIDVLAAHVASPATPLATGPVVQLALLGAPPLYRLASFAARE